MFGLAYLVARTQATWRCEACGHGASCIFLHSGVMFAACSNCYTDFPL